jgi:predicted nucleotidyltransferase
MRFHGLSTALLGSPARTAVLAAMLRSKGEAMTGREVARRAGVSPPRALDALVLLEAERLCSRRRAGRASLWALNPNHFLAERLAPLAELDEAPRRSLIELLQGRLRGAEEAYLFGSVAEDRGEPGSDIDVLIVFRDGEAKRRWARGLNDLQDLVLTKFGNHLEAIAYTRRAVASGGSRRLLETARKTGIRLAVRT